MRRILFLSLLVVVGCTQKPAEKPAEDDVEWKAMDDFHMLMADVYHPLKDSGNLEPIRKNADLLAEEAAKWADGELPSKVNNDEVKGLLLKLKDGSRALADEIQNGATDDVTSAKLTELHEIFHHITEKWYEGPGEEHKEHH